MTYSVPALIAAIGICASQLSAASLTFSLAQADPNFNPIGTTGFQLAYAGGAAVLSKTAGQGDGTQDYESVFQFEGNFTVTVDVDGSNLGSGNAGLGIHLYSPANTSPIDIYYAGYAGAADQINANLQGYGSGFSNGRTGTFEISRTGLVVTESFDSGSGFEAVDSGTEWAGPADIVLFLDEELNGTGASSATFSNLNVTADSISGTASPEPASLSLLTLALSALTLRRWRK